MGSICGRRVHSLSSFECALQVFHPEFSCTTYYVCLRHWSREVGTLGNISVALSLQFCSCYTWTFGFGIFENLLKFIPSRQRFEISSGIYHNDSFSFEFHKILNVCHYQEMSCAFVYLYSTCEIISRNNNSAGSTPETLIFIIMINFRSNTVE